ncbi:hypothetical protein VP01_12686g1, partial [Puccinia sorghi]
YTSDWFMLPAYKRKELIDHQNVNFNYHLSQSQVRIEHAIGILKVRFSSLRELQTQIRNHKEMKDTIKWIISCVILHKLLEDLRAQWNELYVKKMSLIQLRWLRTKLTTQTMGYVASYTQLLVPILNNLHDSCH